VGRKYIPDLEERLIAETISVGGKNEANVDFSTKDIAKACGVSEFTLFQRFESKEKLISACNLKICDDGSALFHHWSHEDQVPLKVFAARVLDYFLSHPCETMFLVNYSAATSHIMKDQAAFERYHAYIMAHRDLLEPYFGSRDEDETFLLWSSFFRRLLMDAQFVLSDLYSDVATYREKSVKVALEGLKGFCVKQETW